ncbi:hypothetical protein [Gleimia hominis]|uniref:hypothetical protein n=1 Tax=Gleimia hominis TaxID=595468 RepID=UPI000CC51D90|nr:hypothetical protein [Gleimia hominis]WIK64051.1 hypothetical protein CJ187_007000 [Gleimia hominis]
MLRAIAPFAVRYFFYVDFITDISLSGACISLESSASAVRDLAMEWEGSAAASARSRQREIADKVEHAAGLARQAQASCKKLQALQVAQVASALVGAP